MENTGSTRRRFARLKAIAYDMREALLAEDLEQVGRLLAREWAERRRLAPKVSFPALDAAVARARRAGALGGKLCGAGGGGCLVMLAAHGKGGAVERVLEEAGFRIMPFRVSKRGLVVGGGAKG